MAASDLIINVSNDKYSARISTLQGYVNSLEGILQQYQTQRAKVDSIWTDTEADEYKNAIDTNIQKVQESIDATNTQIAQLQNLVQNMEQTSSGIRSTVEESLKLAQNLFT